ncbi:RING finger protein 37 [Anastrepha obliqua]|uniref:RING finger protein 37 n=1 Tax=Anastrepha obliqua TaxID=95512 RepID=UPI00240A5E66|nr:RING finger protein 37 [Anastrepha obliqua]
MSLINFLNSKLKPSVECDALCEDGYTANNLIADDAEQLSRGFMAYAVTKPPVEIIFDFPKAVEVKVIKLWNSNGALRSTSFELHGKFEGIWERVAYARDLAEGVDSVTFCYQSDYNSRSNAESAATQAQSVKAFFFKTAHRLLCNASSLKVIICATKRSPPVLRKIEVWGLPSRTLEKADRELVKTVWSEIVHPHGFRTAPDRGQRSPSRNVPELNEYSTLKIPEEFLDEITWELMIFPTVLPSGKIVDQSTIDKHSEVEAKWGRLPSDPFTGLEFTSHRKAILNLALKARIEKFLMDNSEHFKTVPRSLGSSFVRRSKNRHASQFASLYQRHSSTVGTYSSLSEAFYKSSSQASATATLSSPTLPPKRPRLSDSTTYRSEAPLLTSTATQTLSSTSLSFSSKSAPFSMAGAAVSSTASSTTIATGIDHAIQEALKNVTRYTCPPAAVKAATCISCKAEEFSYEILTCKHLVCRACLVQLTKDEMCTCKVSFRTSDVERYHKL